MVLDEATTIPQQVRTIAPIQLQALLQATLRLFEVGPRLVERQGQAAQFLAQLQRELPIALLGLGQRSIQPQQARPSQQQQSSRVLVQRLHLQAAGQSAQRLGARCEQQMASQRGGQKVRQES